ncbi:MAG: LysR family transcriptional regulator [Spirochaetales bacterium]|uniref:LysR family transcriptional regulator n=1 Tax=Candidatus Thalassospirochaeta sargassi TaxID=3119039 RepID=A0AAJ1IG99_9SPIO|nr:LysR family transcriptional regulator [Spirochaetales bacterium]
MLHNLDRLKTFYHIYSGKSIVAAAERLHVSQSAVSQSLQKLEEEIKTPLFIRLHKKIIPTAAGEKLFSIVESFMSDLDTCLNELEHSKEVPSGILRIGSPPEFGKTYLSLITAQFMSQYPEVTFSLELGHPGKLLPMLREGKIDFILLDEFLAKKPYSGNLDIFHFMPVAHEGIILTCSKEYYDKHIKDDLSFSSLSKQDYISYTADNLVVNSWFKHHFSKSAAKFHYVMTVNDHEAVVAAVLNHIGLGVVSSHLVRKELESGRMIKIAAPDTEIINTISLVQLLDKIPTIAEKLFAKFLIDKILSISDEYDQK